MSDETNPPNLEGSVQMFNEANPPDPEGSGQMFDETNSPDPEGSTQMSDESSTADPEGLDHYNGPDTSSPSTLASPLEPQTPELNPAPINIMLSPPFLKEGGGEILMCFARSNDPQGISQEMN